MTDRQLTAALAGSAAAAVRAPSIHNTQPWRWVLHTGSLDLYADRSRQLTSIDPDGRLVLISCGGALHHARVALAADGLGSTVTLLPDRDPDHVATLTPSERIGPDARARELLRAVRHRTGRAADAAPGGTAPAPEAVAALEQAAAAQGVRMRVLGRNEVIALAGASSVTRKVRQRIGHDESTVYAVLFGDEDSPEAWLRAGEALSAVSLEAGHRGLSVYPSWTVVELPGSRKVMREQMSLGGVPYLALRIATEAPGSAPPAPI
jgi:hypothetical protein